jgi:hypothetical protein
MPTRTEAIKNLLTALTLPDLAELYNHDMEVQVNVAKDAGERVEGDYRGKKWQGYSDGVTTWKGFRIPYKANSEPEYTDLPIKFDLEQHAEGIGMTGWDWKQRVSKWVAFDFDAIIGHSDAHNKKLTDYELEEVVEAAKKLPWVTLRKSTSGSGLHLYVFLDDVETDNHNEHAALARSILGLMSGLTGFDFTSKVDVCGAIMWCWHRKMKNTDGLKLIKQGDVLKDVPINWRDHVKVVKGTTRRNLPNTVEERGITDPFEALVTRKVHVKLDDEHKRHIGWLTEHSADCVWWWDADNHMLVTHTVHLKQLHEALDLKGVFDTISRHSSPQNCFMFPMRGGGWAIRRYSLGVSEHPSWEQDGNGWTRCYLNMLPSLMIACRTYNGIEDTNGEFQFARAEDAVNTCLLMGVHVKVDGNYNGRKAWLKQHKDGRLIFSMERSGDEVLTADSAHRDWLVKKDRFQKILGSFAQQTVEPESNNHDELVRHVISESDEDAGWLIKADEKWHVEPVQNIKFALGSYGISGKEMTEVLGSAVINCWQLTNRPFQPEYPGDRKWNRDAAQLRYVPSDPTGELNYPTWTKILEHCGAGLDDAVNSHAWCKANGIKNGGEYLKCWVASLFFFYSSEQNTGKSSFHEALSSLLTKGYIKANNALDNPQGFNGELMGTVLDIIEEKDISKGIAYNRIKDWVTGRDICIHPKSKTPFHQVNTTHWVQTANHHNYCPIFPGDTRITMINVFTIDPMDMIPQSIMTDKLHKEAPDFLAEVLNLDLPTSDDRLNVPVIDTSEKLFMQSVNMNELEMFISEKCEICDGNVIKFSEFYDQYVSWLDAGVRGDWSKIRVGKSFSPRNPKGRLRGTAQFHVGNLKWRKDDVEPANYVYVLGEGDYLAKKQR